MRRTSSATLRPIENWLITRIEVFARAFVRATAKGKESIAV
jgi:hypothetical protein